jgi:predicted component of type VI protein secretion system
MYYRLVPEKPILGVGPQGWSLKLPATIGRSGDTDVCIDDESISRSHCQLFLGSDESLQVRDLNSLNGTFVNGERIKKVHSLFPGDVVQVGSAFLRVEYASDTDPGKPPPRRQASQTSVTQPMKAPSPERYLEARPPQPAKRWWEFWK